MGTVRHRSFPEPPGASTAIYPAYRDGGVVVPRSGKVKVLVPALLLFAAASGRVRALDLDLAAFVERVGSSSTSLRLARLDLSSANADRQSATSLALPRVDLSAGYGRELLEPDPIAPMQLRNQVQASAGVSQTLFNMSVLYALRASSYLDGMTRAQVEAVRQAVINGARKAFYGTLLAREVREVSRESESAAAGISKSDVVRRRLEGMAPRHPRIRHAPTFFELAADLIGSVDDEAIPRDLSARRKGYLKKWGYGKNRHR